MISILDVMNQDGMTMKAFEDQVISVLASMSAISMNECEDDVNTVINYIVENDAHEYTIRIERELL